MLTHFRVIWTVAWYCMCFRLVGSDVKCFDLQCDEKLRSNWRHNKTPTQILPGNSGHSKSWFANFAYQLCYPIKTFRILLHNGNRKFNVSFILIIFKFRYLTFFKYIIKLIYLIKNLPVCGVLKLLFWDNIVNVVKKEMFVSVFVRL